MATAIIRDSQFGQIVRYLTGRRILKYPEEASDKTCKYYLVSKGLVEEKNPQNIWGLYTFVSACLGNKEEDDEEKEPNPNIVNWTGVDDPENPKNWSLGKKQFGVSQVAATLGLRPMAWSPLSEIPVIGRNPVYIYTLLVFTFFQFAVVYAKDFGILLAFRFLTGVLGSPVLATGGASLGDIWHPIIRDYMIAVWGAIAIAAPVVGPLIGGFASQAKGWTWTIWELLWLSRRAQRLCRITGMKDLTTEAEAEFAGTPKQRIILETLLRPFMLCFTEPIVLVLDIYITLIYGIFYLWIEAFPIVFEEIHGFSLGEGGLSFLRIMVACCNMAIPLYCGWKYFFQRKHYSDDGDIAPEKQLPPACMFFALGGCLIFYCIFTYLMGAYPKYAASVLAGNDFMRSCFGAGFPIFASAMFHNLGVNWACTLLGCLTVLFVPAPFVLLRLGRRLRMASKYARHDI
ncbi:major facilitator superfamily domain-containing protein [Aspergillus oleicola]